MIKNYLAIEKDLNAIDEALRFVWHPKLNFVFKDRSKISKTLVISYDSKFIYIWKPLFGNDPGKYKLHKIPHKLRIKNEWQGGWWAGLVDKSINKFLPASFKPNNQFAQPIISGGLLKPFVELQKNKKLKSNPYVTKQSYLATIIHEFGHVYWNQHKLWWYSEKKYNLELLTTAKKLYQKKPNDKLNTSFRLPTNPNMGEVFAYCAEYCAASIFWPSHKKALDKFAIKYITKLVDEEKIKELDKEDSALELGRNPHAFALVLGKVLMTGHLNNWPSILTAAASSSLNA